MDAFIYYVIIFFLCGLIGWLNEVLLTIIEEKKFVNRGFLVGPVLPIWGFGGVSFTFFLTKYYNDPLVVFFGAVVISAILEYFTSWALEKIFKARWWDYSNKSFNVNGRICLLYAFGFGFGALLCIYIINPYIIAGIYKLLPEELIQVIGTILLALLTFDTFVSFSIISKLKRVSNTVRSDNTEQITKEVKKRLIDSAPYKRLIEAFPNVKINNSMSLIKQRLIESKDKYMEKRKANKERYKELKKEAKKTRKFFK